MNRTRDDLLAYAAFSGNEHLGVGRRGAENLLLYFSQNRACTDELNRVHKWLIFSSAVCCGGDIYTRLRLTSQPLNVQEVRYSSVADLNVGIPAWKTGFLSAASGDLGRSRRAEGVAKQHRRCAEIAGKDIREAAEILDERAGVARVRDQHGVAPDRIHDDLGRQTVARDEVREMKPVVRVEEDVGHEQVGRRLQEYSARIDEIVTDRQK